MIADSKMDGRPYLPILTESDYSEYNIEGYVQLDSYSFNLDGELQLDQIEREEIIETNKEYSYYSKHFAGQVISFKSIIKKRV